MVIVSPLSRVVPLPNGLWLVNGGYLPTSEPILQGFYDCKYQHLGIKHNQKQSYKFLINEGDPNHLHPLQDLPKSKIHHGNDLSLPNPPNTLKGKDSQSEVLAALRSKLLLMERIRLTS